MLNGLLNLTVDFFLALALLLNTLSLTARRVSLKEGQTLGVALRVTDALR